MNIFDPADIGAFLVRIAPNDKLAPTLRAIGSMGTHPAIVSAVRRRAAEWSNALCQYWNRKNLMHNDRLSAEEVDFVELLSVSECAFVQVTELIATAHAGQAISVVTSGGALFRAFTRGERRLEERMMGVERGGAARTEAAYLAALSSHARRPLPISLAHQLAQSAVDSASQGPLAQFATDFGSLCRAPCDDQEAEPLIDSVVHAVRDKLDRSWEPVLVAYTAAALARLPRVGHQIARLGELVSMAVASATRFGRSERDALEAVWDEVLDMLWSSAPLMSKYLNDWSELAARLPDRHLVRLAQATSAEAVPPGAAVVLQWQIFESDRMIVPFAVVAAHASATALLTRVAAQPVSSTDARPRHEVAAILATAAQEARGLGPVWRDADRQLRPEIPHIPPSLFDAALGDASSGNPATRSVILLAHAEPERLVAAFEALDTLHNTDRIEALAEAVVRIAPSLTSRLMGAHVLRSRGVHGLLEAFAKRRTLQSKVNWPELAALVLQRDASDEASLAVSCIGDTMTTPCVEFIRSRLETPRSADRRVVHAYMQALVATPQIDTPTLGLICAAISSHHLISPADVEDRLLLAARADRSPSERALVLELIASHRFETTQLSPRRSTGVAIDYTGRAQRELMALIVLLGPDSRLTDRERMVLVVAARRAVHPWVTSLVALTLGGQSGLSTEQAKWLAELARPPSVALDFAALAISGARSRFGGRSSLDIDQAAARVTASIVAHSIGELLRRNRQGSAILSPLDVDLLARRLRRLTGADAPNLAHIRAYRQLATVPRIITSPLYMGELHPDSFDFVLAAHRALRRSEPIDT